MLLQARMAREEQEWKKKQNEEEARKQPSWFKWN